MVALIQVTGTDSPSGLLRYVKRRKIYLSCEGRDQSEMEQKQLQTYYGHVHQHDYDGKFSCRVASTRLRDST